jgi:hypothetical protein
MNRWRFHSPDWIAPLSRKLKVPHASVCALNPSAKSFRNLADKGFRIGSPFESMDVRLTIRVMLSLAYTGRTVGILLLDLLWIGFAFPTV